MSKPIYYYQMIPNCQAQCEIKFSYYFVLDCYSNFKLPIDYCVTLYKIIQIKV